MTAKISDADRAQHTNLIDQKFIDYVNHIDPELSNNIGYTRLVNMNLLEKSTGKHKLSNFQTMHPTANQTRWFYDGRPNWRRRFCFS